MKSKDRTGSTSADIGFTLTRTFDAPRHLLFEAWTKPDQLKQWSAPHGFTISHSEGDARPGGSWRACMRTPEGEELWLSGVYQQVVPDTSLVFTHAWEEDGKRDQETLVSVQFEDKGSATKLIFSQTGFESLESRDGHESGWKECMDRLAEHLTTLREAKIR
jgi:uncharacterized protein YndB with AHSA1/START domain